MLMPGVADWHIRLCHATSTTGPLEGPTISTATGSGPDDEMRLTSELARIQAPAKNTSSLEMLLAGGRRTIAHRAERSHVKSRAYELQPHDITTNDVGP